MPELNGVIMQYFHWYMPPNGSLWSEATHQATDLAQAGFTAIWLPPAYKGMGGPFDAGYGTYDLFDLGEFLQKGAVRTKYGTRDQYLAAIQALHRAGLQVYADAVLNHKIGGDLPERLQATPYAQNNRIRPKGALQPIRSYTHFTFPGRQGQYSRFEWHWQHFSAVDHDLDSPNDYNTIYLVEGRQFDDATALLQGNFVYLMGCDPDFQNPWVQDDITHWGKWYVETTGIDGFRLDAMKSASTPFFTQWIDTLKAHAGKPLFLMGEYWYNNLAILQNYIAALQGQLSVFDVCLHYNFHAAGKAGSSYDMRRILEGSLVQADPIHAVTFVDNHDSQPLQALESPVSDWFKPLAYALILLRKQGYPCVFYADYYGADYEDDRDGQNQLIHLPPHRWLLDRMLYARRHFAYGAQYDYFDDVHLIGWTRLGDATHPHAMAVVLSNSSSGSKWMEVGKPNTRFIDITEHIQEPVQTNADGWGQFFCRGGSVSIWLEEATSNSLFSRLGRAMQSMLHA